MFARLKWIVPLALSLALGIVVGLNRPDPPPRLAFFSVGQGDCAAVLEGDSAILIDAGPAGHGVDAGKRFVVPKLRALGIAHVPLILLSHPDMDHLGGVKSVIKAFPEAKLVVSQDYRQHSGLRAYLTEAKLSEDRIVWVQINAKITFGRTTLDIACPPFDRKENDNNGSMFVYVQRGETTATFTGDAPESVETRMLRVRSWQADILHIGHHGSKTATAEAWLAAVRPSQAVISCGRNNVYHHPHPNVLAKLKAHQIPVWRTDQQGDLVIPLQSPSLPGRG